MLSFGIKYSVKFTLKILWSHGFYNQIVDYDSIIYTYVIHVAASSIVNDNVTNKVTHRILIPTYNMLVLLSHNNNNNNNNNNTKFV